jgi:hypothetical protein
MKAPDVPSPARSAHTIGPPRVGISEFHRPRASMTHAIISPAESCLRSDKSSSYLAPASSLGKDFLLLCCARYAISGHEGQSLV